MVSGARLGTEAQRPRTAATASGFLDTPERQALSYELDWIENEEESGGASRRETRTPRAIIFDILATAMLFEIISALANCTTS